MAEIFYDLTKPNNGMNYRWIQPPQIAYFVNTIDNEGNVNTTPATLGTCVSVDMELDASGNYFFTFSLGSSDLPHVPKRHSVRNLEQNPECVISFIGSKHVREAQIACLPLPEGIDEVPTAGLTPMKSKMVKPPGIVECGINLEARVVHSHQLGQYYRHYICQVIAVSVDEELVKKDAANPLHAGIIEIDPMLEITVLQLEGRPARLHLVKLDYDSVERMPDDIGPQSTFVGKFEGWMKDELDRGGLSAEGYEQMLKLHEEWRANPSAVTNAAVKNELTRRLRELIN